MCLASDLCTPPNEVPQVIDHSSDLFGRHGVEGSATHHDVPRGNPHQAPPAAPLTGHREDAFGIPPMDGRDPPASLAPSAVLADDDVGGLQPRPGARVFDADHRFVVRH